MASRRQSSDCNSQGGEKVIKIKEGTKFSSLFFFFGINLFYRRSLGGLARNMPSDNIFSDKKVNTSRGKSAEADDDEHHPEAQSIYYQTADGAGKANGKSQDCARETPFVGFFPVINMSGEDRVPGRHIHSHAEAIESLQGVNMPGQGGEEKAKGHKSGEHQSREHKIKIINLAMITIQIFANRNLEQGLHNPINRRGHSRHSRIAALNALQKENSKNRADEPPAAIEEDVARDQSFYDFVGLFFCFHLLIIATENIRLALELIEELFGLGRW